MFSVLDTIKFEILGPVLRVIKGIDLRTQGILLGIPIFFCLLYFSISKPTYRIIDPDDEE